MLIVVDDTVDVSVVKVTVLLDTVVEVRVLLDTVLVETVDVSVVAVRVVAVCVVTVAELVDDIVVEDHVVVVVPVVVVVKQLGSAPGAKYETAWDATSATMTGPTLFSSRQVPVPMT